MHASSRPQRAAIVIGGWCTRSSCRVRQCSAGREESGRRRVEGSRQAAGAERMPSGREGGLGGKGLGHSVLSSFCGDRGVSETKTAHPRTRTGTLVGPHRPPYRSFLLADSFGIHCQGVVPLRSARLRKPLPGCDSLESPRVRYMRCCLLSLAELRS